MTYLNNLSFLQNNQNQNSLVNTDNQYDEVIGQARDVFVKKTHDYGTAWRILRTCSLTDQIFIKASRIRSIQEKKQKKINESVEGEFVAIVNYAVMAMIQLMHPVKDGDFDLDPIEANQHYDKYIAETKALMQNKNHDYGEAWRDMRVSSITDLILMKLLRIKQIEDNDGQTLISEGLDANYQDIINYAVFALILMKEKES